MKSVHLYSTSTCVPCKTLVPTLEAVCSDKGLNLIYFTIDNLDPQEIAGLNIRTVPTVIVRQGEEEISRFSGVKNKAWIEEHLE